MLFYRRRGRSPTARARARRRAPHSPHRTHDVFRGVFRDHRAMRVRRLAGASIHRGARVLRAAIFGRATRDARARDARRRRRWECDVTLDGARAGASRARRTRGGARAAKRGGIILSARCAAAEGGGRARCARGRARRSTSPWRRPPYPFTRRGRRRAMRRARTAREGRRCGEMVEGNLRARGRRARTAREGRDD